MPNHHPGAQLVEDLERRLVSTDAKLTLELDRGEAGRERRREAGSPKPHAQRRVRALHDGSRRQRKRYTPGPWRLFNKNRTVSVMAGEGPRNEVVSWTGFDASDFPKQVVANARLIAAAPELYEALVGLMPFMVEDEMKGESEWEVAVLQAVAAVAKARG